MDYTKRVKEIVAKVLSIDLNNIDIDVNTAITGESIGADAVELVYIIVEIMNEFGVRFNASDFENYSCNTIQGISNALLKHMHDGDKS